MPETGVQFNGSHLLETRNGVRFKMITDLKGYCCFKCLSAATQMLWSKNLSNTTCL